MRKKMLKNASKTQRIVTKLTAIVLLLAMVITSIPFGQLGLVNAEGDSGKNANMNSSIHFSLKEGSLKYTADGETKEFVESTDADGNVTLDFAENESVNSLQSFEYCLEFTIDDPDIRTINEGDYITIPIPEGTTVFNSPGEELKDGEGNVYATLDSDAIDDGYFKYVFTEVLARKDEESDENSTDEYKPALYNVKGKLSFGFTFNERTEGDNLPNNVMILNKMNGIDKEYSMNLLEKAEGVSGITKKGVVNPSDNSILWTITVGSDAKCKGNSLNGVVITDTYNANELEYVESHYGDDEITGHEPEVEGDVATFTYTFGASDTAPATITIKTTMTNELLKAANELKIANIDNPQDTEVENHVSMLAAEGETPETATASVVVPTFDLDKQAEQIDANTIQWTLIINEEQVNVYHAIIWDNLMTGLSIKDDYGVKVYERSTDDEGNKTDGTPITLTSSHSSDTLGSEEFQLTSEHASDKLSLELVKPFSKEYKVVFRTEVSKGLYDLVSGGEDSENPAHNIENTAFAEFSFPEGDGPGPSIEYHTCTVKQQFLTAFLTITGEKVDGKEGILYWYAIPSCKQESEEAVVILKCVDGESGPDQEVIGDSVTVTAKGDTDITGCYVIDTTAEQQIKVTIDSTALRDKGLELKDLKIKYQTKALNYVASDADTLHVYHQKGSIEVSNSEVSYKYNKAKAKLELQNKLLEKTVELLKAKDNEGENYYHFKLLINQEGMDLTNLTVTDDLSSCLFLTDSKDPADGDGTALDSEDFEIVTTGDMAPYLADKDDDTATKVTDGTIDISGHSVTFTADAETQKKALVLHIYVKLTERGKKSLGLQQNANYLPESENAKVKGQYVYAVNKATLTSDKLSDSVEAECDSRDSEDVINLAIVKKAAEQEKVGNEYTSIIHWTLTVNDACINHVGDSVQAMTFVDRIPDGLALDRSSVKINGNKVTLRDTDYTKEYDATTNEPYSILKLQYTPSSVTECFVITYDTIIVDDAKTFTNTVSAASGDRTSALYSGSIKAHAYSEISGCSKSIFTLMKVDSLSDSKNVIPLSGVKFGMYRSDNDELVDEGFTNASGKLTLMGDYQEEDPSNPGTKKAISYYIKELEIKGSKSDEYVADTTTKYGLYSTNGRPGRKKIQPMKNSKAIGLTNFTNNRIENPDDVATATIVKKFDDKSGAGAEITGQTATFKLYAFPMTSQEEILSEDISNFDVKYAYEVHLKHASGTDTYEYMNPEEARKDKTGVTTIECSGCNAGEETSFDITNLPWGTYGIVETAAPDGYVGTNIGTQNPKIFSVIKDADTQEMKVIFQTKSGDTDTDRRKFDAEESGKGIITNYQTEVMFDKLAEGKAADFFRNTHVQYKITAAAGSKTGFADSSTTSVIVEAQDLGTKVFYGVFKTGVTYIVNEVEDSIPAGYKKSPEFKFTINDSTGTVKIVGTSTLVKVDSTDANKINIKEEPISLSFEKKDQNGAFVEGAKICIHGDFANSDGSIIEDQYEYFDTTDGTISLNDVNCHLVAGKTYTLTEFQTPEGYVDASQDGRAKVIFKVEMDGKLSIVESNDIRLKATLDTTKTKLILTNIKIQADVVITKVDKTDHSIKLPGAKFALYKEGESSPMAGYSSLTTDANGLIKIQKLPFGNYKLKEISAPTHYKLDSNPISIKVKRENIKVEDDLKSFSTKDITVTAENERKEVSLTFTKTNKSGTILPGATYGLYKAGSDTKVESKTTGDDGTLTFNNLEWYTAYYLLEETAPVGYICNRDKIKIDAFTKDYVGSEELRKTDKDSPIEVSFTLKNLSNESIPDSEFEIYDVETGSLVNQFETTNHNGMVITNLKIDHPYKIVEKKSNDLYLSANGNELKFTIDKYGVVTMESPATDQRLTSDHLESQGPTDGKVTLFNEQITTRLVMTKTDANNRALRLQGAKFRVLRDGVVIGTYTTGIDGKITVEQLIKGHYEVQEISAANGYAADSFEGLEFDVTAYDHDREITKTVTNKKTSLRIQTVVDLGETIGNETPNELEPLSGVKIGIYDNADCSNLIKELTTDSEGYLTDTGLKEGTYYVKELDVNGENINQNTTVYKLVVGETSTLTDLSGNAVKDSQIINTVYRGQFSFIKVDAKENSTTLAGSVYEVFEVAQSFNEKIGRTGDELTGERTLTKVGEATTSATGEIVLYNLRAGASYKIKEKEAPAGYQLSKDAITVVMKKASAGFTEVDEVNLDTANMTLAKNGSGAFIWNEPRLELKINKVDNKGAFVEGAHLQLIEKVGDTETVLDDWISGDGGEESHEISVAKGIHLKGGSQYILREVDAPEGYVKASDLKFTVAIKHIDSEGNAEESDGAVQVVVLVNKKPSSHSGGGNSHPTVINPNQPDETDPTEPTNGENTDDSNNQSNPGNQTEIVDPIDDSGDAGDPSSQDPNNHNNGNTGGNTDGNTDGSKPSEQDKPDNNGSIHDMKKTKEKNKSGKKSGHKKSPKTGFSFFKWLFS